MQIPNAWSVFNQLATPYQKRPGYAVEVLRSLDKRLAHTRGTARIADIGSGTGIFTRQIAEHVTNAFAIYGIEPSIGMRDVACKQDSAKPIEYLSGSGEAIPLPYRSLDCVTAANSAHRFNRPIFFKQTSNLLRSGGVLLILDNLPSPNLSSFHDRYLSFQEEHVSSYKRGMNSDGFGGYFFMDICSELVRSGLYFDVTKYNWEHEHSLDASSFSELANSSSVNLKVIEAIGQTQFDRAVSEIFRENVSLSGRVTMNYRTEAVFARLAVGTRVGQP
ncbi:methyltransferase family protein [Ensifer sp. SEMIA 135]|uniref:class I SAM-dependent methyltransferase n=1 Tax=Rhizobium meliloti TaxID=382 RepID=UPI00119934C7|nr:class I SAM-dependent methyltransferase [Sinorhizobium meliloti]TWA88511.1 methyltransferase family protein [Ensifer sp. SEMIA 134]TWB24045.1 methyltransferase family protein [Ensifer sp. SEMIA 135]